MQNISTVPQTVELVGGIYDVLLSPTKESKTGTHWAPSHCVSDCTPLTGHRYRLDPGARQQFQISYTFPGPVGTNLMFAGKVNVQENTGALIGDMWVVCPGNSDERTTSYPLNAGRPF